MSSVRARTSQFENKQQQQQQENKKKSSSKKKQVIEEDSSSSEDEGGFEFADLVRALTGGGDSSAASSTAEAIEALRETFKILDCDGDGAITLDDLRSALNGFGGDDDDDEEEASRPEDDELAEMIAAADDADGEGRISFENFVKVVDPKLAAKHFGARKK